jgi:hypothetical protein
MPKINPARPAAVYLPAVPEAQSLLLPVLTERRLYVLDSRTETLDDLQKSVMERPVLRLHVLHAAAGPEHGAAVFVTDSLATISPDPEERTAVIGALLETDCEVVVDGVNLDKDWYMSRVRGSDIGKIDDLVEGLLSFRDDASRLWGRWSTWETDGPLTILPNSLGIGFADTRMRIRDLAEFEQMKPAQIAERLLAEGHRNAQRRHVWYPQAVRDALAAGL